MPDPQAGPVERSRHEPYAALRHVNFRWFVASLLTMTIASQIQAVVVSWQLYRITRDPLSLGLIGLAEVIPYVSVALLAGHLVDRGDRRRISAWALLLLTVAAAALLFFAAGPELPRAVWPYYAIIGICGIARSFLQSSRSALMSEIVPRETFVNAATWRSSTWQLGTVLGPAAGGLLLGHLGATTAYSFNLALALLALASMLLIRFVPIPRADVTGSVRESLAQGIAFVRSERVLFGALTLDLFAVLFGGAVALLPVFAAEVLHVGAQGLGTLQAGPGIGAVCMAVYIAHRGQFERAGRTLLVTVTVFGACMIGFALSRVFWLSFALLVLSGAADNISAVIRSTLIQVLTPTELMGRVSAVNAVFIGSSNELGAFESGAMARVLGTVPSVVFGGTMTLAVVAGMTRRVPELLQLRRIERRVS
ncbi:MAG: Enterobactin exporter EntS [Gemmatimonadaceae bacterium]|nr:Enterobactin exporter EntS [Gemmatimonadaceae bacterium]